MVIHVVLYGNIMEIVNILQNFIVLYLFVYTWIWNKHNFNLNCKKCCVYNVLELYDIRFECNQNILYLNLKKVILQIIWFSNRTELKTY